MNRLPFQMFKVESGPSAWTCPHSSSCTNAQLSENNNTAHLVFWAFKTNIQQQQQITGWITGHPQGDMQRCH